MNRIASYDGTITPYFRFTTTSGATISTLPSDETDSRVVFRNFTQDRTVREAATFTVEFDYFPPTFAQMNGTYVHEILLRSAGQKVHYEMGYSTKSGADYRQDSEYYGIFTSYTETFNDTYISYSVTGVAAAVEGSSKECSIKNYLKELRDIGAPIKPSTIVKNLISGKSPEIQEYFRDIDWSDISEADDPIDPAEININDGTIHDVLMGTLQDDGTVSGGLVSYSAIGIYQSSDINDINIPLSAIIAGAKSKASGEIQTPFIAYFDNMRIGSKRGSFHYRPVRNGEQAIHQFTYSFGNSEKHSDVLSVDISYDCTVAIALAESARRARFGTDAAGNLIGSNQVLSQASGFNRESFTSLSRMSSEQNITLNEIIEALDFPIEVKITILGQLETCKLLDHVLLTILVNGGSYEVVSGNFKVLEVHDDISSSGFQTTLTLLKETKNPFDSSKVLFPPTDWYSESAEAVNKSINAIDKRNAKYGL